MEPASLVLTVQVVLIGLLRVLINSSYITTRAAVRQAFSWKRPDLSDASNPKGAYLRLI